MKRHSYKKELIFTCCAIKRKITILLIIYVILHNRNLSIRLFIRSPGSG